MKPKTGQGPWPTTGIQDIAKTLDVQLVPSILYGTIVRLEARSLISAINNPDRSNPWAIPELGQRITTRVNIFESLFLVAVWPIALKLLPHNSYVLALGGMTYLGPFIISTMFTSLKTRSAKTRAILIGSKLVATTAICLLAGYIADL